MDSTKLVNLLKEIKMNNPGLSFLIDMNIRKAKELDTIDASGEKYSWSTLINLQMLENQLSRDEIIKLIELAEEYAKS